ncbi:MAG: protein-glutamate O-methyltransferase CheR [Kiritimatiellales bacterium]|jgi:chemotaxis methyl-accepting protein methylase
MKRKNTETDSPAATVRILEQVHGLDISPYEESFLRKSIDKRLAATGIETVAAYDGYLAEHREEAEIFCSSLRVIYSEFFRNPLAFAVLEQVILPGLIAEKKQSGRGGIRVWSAGCAAGEEVWSIAMLLDELTGAENRTLSYRIFASDLSDTDLSCARTGIYTADELKNVRLRHLDTCFARQGGVYSIVPRIRSQVQFASYDLLETNTVCPPASIYGEFDLVLCSNVLLYYRHEAQVQILSKLRESLACGGYLVTGETERQIVADRIDGFCAAVPPSSVFQKKNIYHE